MRPRRPACSAAAALSLLLAAVSPAVAEPVVFRLEPERSFVQFEVLHFGTSTSRGRFGPIAGEVTLDREAHTGSARIVIDTTGVSTGLRVFDARIRRADLLASTDFPQAVFAVEVFRFDGDRLVEVSGTLTLRGVSRPLVLRALRFGCQMQVMPPVASQAASQATSQAAPEACGGDFEGELLRSDFGIDYLLPLVADRVRLQVQVQGRAP